MNKKFDSKKISRKEIVNYLNQSSEIAEYQLTLIDEIVKVTEVCIETLNNGGKIIFCGNIYKKILNKRNVKSKKIFYFDEESKIIDFLNMNSKNYISVN